MDSSDSQVYIWSIWPERLAAHRPYKPASRINANGHFSLAPGSVEKPQFIAIGHFSEKVPAGWGKTIQSMDSTTAYHVGTCLVNEWANNRAVDLPGNVGIGVWLSDIDSVEKMVASREFRERIGRQNAYCDAMIERARDLHRQKKYEQISQEYFLCAKIRNIDGEDWQIRSPAYGGETQKCPWCRVVVSVDAPVCHHCDRVVNVAAYRSLMEATGQVVDALPAPKPMPTPVPAMAGAVNMAAEAPMPEPEPIARAASLPLDEAALKAQLAEAAKENAKLKAGR